MEDEDQLLISLQAVMGNRWSEIARAFAGQARAPTADSHQSGAPAGGPHPRGRGRVLCNPLVLERRGGADGADGAAGCMAQLPALALVVGSEAHGLSAEVRDDARTSPPHSSIFWDSYSSSEACVR